MRCVTLLAWTCLFAFSIQAVDSALSIPLARDSVRALQVAAQSREIKNVARTMTIGSDVVPLYDGPVASPGSLAEKIRLSEAAILASHTNFRPTYVAKVAVSQAAKLRSMNDFVALYDLMSPQLPRPMAADNSDASFGRQRLTIKAMKLRRVGLGEFTSPSFLLSNAQLAQFCGNEVSWLTIRSLKNLYVEEFEGAADWNDLTKTNYIPNVVGFFCYNRQQQKLLPIEIRFPDSALSYSPLDSADEWTLAKMGLNAASTAYHQWQHMADTHATTIPIRVELLRSMAPVHPVRALLQHHMTMDMGLEMLAQTILFAPGTPHDKLFGWGARGSARFVDHQLLTSNSIQRDFLTDIAQRGLEDIPTHKYAIFGRRLYDAIATFVRRYVGVYYVTDLAVAGDSELQKWTQGCASVPHLKDFPTVLATKAQLQKLVTHLIFLSAVRHHAMNGAATWHSLSVPYSLPALWKQMPTKKLVKGQSLNLTEYTVPVALVHEVLGLAATFLRDLTANQTLAQAYRTEPFASEPALVPVIDEFEMRLQEIDTRIQESEQRESAPYDLLQSANLPANEWI